MYQRALMHAAHTTATQLEQLPFLQTSHSVDGCDEASEYQSKCSAEHKVLADHLHRTRGRRGLFIEFTGNSIWGLGHALWNVYVIHDMCLQLERYCHIKMYDMSLSALMGYASGNLSWGKPGPAELARYHAVGGFAALKWKYAKWSGSKANSLFLIHELRQPAYANASFIHVTTPGPLQLIQASGAASELRVLHFNQDLRRRTQLQCAPPIGRFDREFCRQILPRLTRCFCRFVTEPRFAIPPSSWSATFQLRTGYADISDRVIPRIDRMRTDGHAATCPLPQYAEMDRWLHHACQSAAALDRLATGFVLTDAPVLREYITLDRLRCESAATKLTNESGYDLRTAACDGLTAGCQSHPAWIRSRQSGLMLTRSWDSNLAAKRLAFSDLVVASRSRVAYLGASSFALPMVARSVCLERIHKLSHASSPCPKFSSLYPRAFFGVTWKSKALLEFKSSTQPSLAYWHPCKRSNASLQCFSRYVASVAGCTIGAASQALRRGLVPK